MTFYQKEVIRLTEALYAKDYLTQQIIQAKHFIENHFAEKIRLADYASQAFCSTFYFIRLFKTYYGCTPHQYLITVRIAEAKALLQKGKTVADVCFLVGFESVPTFTTLFKKYTGSAPFGYQQKSKKAILNKPDCP